MNRHFRTWAARIWYGIVWLPERFIIAQSCPYGDPAIFDGAAFSWTAPLEANWQDIRGELDEVLRSAKALPNVQDLVPEIRVSDNDRWKAYFLYGYGHKVEAHCVQCPRTTRLIEQVPGMTTAFFSILHPYKHIPKHRGPYKGFLRYHLGLIVPEPPEACRIRVGDEITNWREGKSLILDDTKPHEVWNDTDGVRVVLFMDVVRPLPRIASRINRTIVRWICRSPQVRRARGRQAEWIERQH